MSHRCQKIVDLLLDYIEGDLPREQAEHLERHFADCPPCLKFLESYKDTGHVCRCAIEKAIPKPMEDALIAHLRNQLQSDK